MAKGTMVKWRGYSVMHRWRNLAAVLAICSAEAAAHAQQIQSDYDQHTDFSRYKTYSWQKSGSPDGAWQSSCQMANTGS